MFNENDQEEWKLAVRWAIIGNKNLNCTANIYSGITTLVGPNGSGKTRALRAIESELRNINSPEFNSRVTRFISAGRSAPLETYRASVHSPRGMASTEAAVGSVTYENRWWEIESVTGDIMALHRRADLKLKVEARLQQLFDRSVVLTWTQNGLSITINQMKEGISYAANHEASGILQLVALLAAIHNEEIFALIIDEPEISLHPQHQAFLLEEMESVAGNPTDSSRKLIIFATHSTSLLALRFPKDLPKFIFFNSIKESPIQISPEDDILKRAKMSALLARLSTTHRMAIFAQRVLLVEGASDEIIASQLARQLGMRLLARNAQILPVTGKGEFPEVSKFFSLMNKKIAIIADLDALTDNNELVNYFNSLPSSEDIAQSMGHKSIIDIDRKIRTDLDIFIDRLDEAEKIYPTLSKNSDKKINAKRNIVARLLMRTDSFNVDMSPEANSLKKRYDVLLKILEDLGCFILRAGAVESYFEDYTHEQSKPDFAAMKAAQFNMCQSDELNARFREIISALNFIAPNQCIDEDKILRPKLSAILAAAFQSMTANTSDMELNIQAKNVIGIYSDLFRLENISKDNLKLRVHIQSKIFSRENFPFEISAHDNINQLVPAILPGVLQ